MESLDFAIGYHKLDTEFLSGHVRHTTFHSDTSRGKRRVEVVENWHRGRELGRGSFGTVFLERSEKGEHRAVKDIVKQKGSRFVIDYKRELMAMARLAKHDALFVQLLGWYESEDYVHIAMEYIGHGHLRQYLEEEERSENEAKAITRQLLEGLSVIHQEGFAHRDLKPENIFVVSKSPVWVKIGDFGLAKLARNGTAFRTQGGTQDYMAPEAGIDPSRETSEYTNAVDIWALGCITHEILTQTIPLRGFRAISSYCTCPKLPTDNMLEKNISMHGIEFVERALAYPPERRITAMEALDLEWLQPEEEAVVVVLETEEDCTGPALPERPAPAAPPEGEVANGDSVPGNGEPRLCNGVAATIDVKDRGAAEGVLSAPAQDKKVVTLINVSPVVDNNQCELQELLGEHKALSEEVAMGLIKNLVIPSPGNMVEKEILFPAHLINIVTCEMLNGGFVGESERLVTNVVQSIQDEVMLNNGDDAINRGAFWLSNAREMLSFVSLAEHWYEIRRKNDCEFDSLLELAKRDLGSLGFNIYQAWMKVLKRKLQKMIVPAMIDSSSLPRFTTKGDNKYLTRLLPVTLAPQYSLDNLLSLLDKIYDALRGYFIEESIVTQAITELLKLIGVTAFNDLLLRRNFLSLKRGKQINQNIERIEEWCKSHYMPEGILQLEHLMHATRLLLNKTTLDNLEFIQDICWKLSPYQIQKLLNHYLVTEHDQPINGEIMKMVTTKVTQKSDALLLQPVDMDDSGPYEMAEPRAIRALETYVPSYLQTDRIRRIAGIVAARTQARAEVKLPPAGCVELEGDMKPIILPTELEVVYE